MNITIIEHNSDVILTTPGNVTTLNFRRNPNLQGQSIRAADAARKYDVTQASLSRWADRGYIRILRQAPRLLELDEGDVHFVSQVYHTAQEHAKNRMQAGWILRRVLEAV